MAINKNITNKLYYDDTDVPDIENTIDDVELVEIDYGNTGSDAPEMNAYQSANDQVAIEEAIPSKDNIEDTIKKTEIEQIMSSNNPDIVRNYLRDSRGINLSKSQALEVIKRFNAPKITEGSGRVRSESTQIKSTFAMEQELDVLKK